MKQTEEVVDIAGAKAGPSPQNHESRPMRAMRPARILLAEDNRINQIIIRKHLEQWGHSVVFVEDGEAASASFNDSAFDLVILDVQMPKLSGYEVAAVIRSAEQASARRTPIIAVTACDTSDDRARCFAAGMDDYLLKPLIPRDLFDCVERLTAARD